MKMEERNIQVMSSDTCHHSEGCGGGQDGRRGWGLHSPRRAAWRHARGRRLRGGGHDCGLPTSSRVLRCSTRSHQRDTTRLTDDASAQTRPASVQQQHRALARTARLVHCCLACRSQDGMLVCGAWLGGALRADTAEAGGCA